MVQQDRTWIPRFLTEPGVRIFLQSLFVAIVSSGENCRTLLNSNPAEIGWGVTRGNKLARNCMIGASRWLEMAEENSASATIFRSQLLEPARAPARFMQTIRQLSPLTASLRGFAFAKSGEFFDSHYSSLVTSLSVIVPRLERTLGIRCKPELLGHLRRGPCRLDGVQPVPLINRLHPARLSTTVEEGEIPLASLDFLKLSMFDLSDLQMSLAFENFSEVQSSEAGLRRLGVTGILGGTLLFVQSPHLIVQSSVDPAITARVLISIEMADGFGGNIKQMRKLEGKPVRMLCTLWYEPRTSKHPSLEGFALQPADDASSLISDDALGYVRLRRRVTTEALKARFGILPSTSSRLKEQNGQFEWIAQPTHEIDVIGEFTKCDSMISELRIPRIASPDDVFGTDKLGLTSVSERISRDKELFQCANAVLRIRDVKESLPGTWTELKERIMEIEPTLKDPRLWWLRLMGLLSKGETGISLTDIGPEAIRRADDKELSNLFERRLFEGQKVFSLIDLEANTRFPPSILLSGLETLAKEGKLIRTEHDILWATPGTAGSELSEAEILLEQFTTRVLSTLQSVYHSLGTLRIIEILGEKGEAYSAFTMGRFLAWMKTQKLVVEPQSGMWLYPWMDRIRNLMRAYSPRYYSVDQVASLCSLPLGAREEIHHILSDLVREGAVEEVLPSRWGARLDEKGTLERTQAIMDHGLSSFIRTNYRGRRLSYDDLVARIEYVILDRVKPPMRISLDHRQLARKLVQGMIERNEIIQDGPYLRIA